MQLDSRLRDDSHRPLSANEQAVEHRAAALTCDRPRADDLPAGQRHFQRPHLLAHRAVLAGAIAHAIRGYRAAHRRDGHAPRIVAQHHPVLLRAGVQVSEVHPRLHPSRPVLPAHGDDAIHAAHVQRDAAAQRHDSAHDAGAAAVRHYCGSMPRRMRHDGRRLCGIGRTRHRGHPRRREPFPPAETMAGYRVERSALARLFIGQHVLRANDAHERSQ